MRFPKSLKWTLVRRMNSADDSILTHWIYIQSTHPHADITNRMSVWWNTSLDKTSFVFCWAGSVWHISKIMVFLFFSFYVTKGEKLRFEILRRPFCLSVDVEHAGRHFHSLQENRCIKDYYPWCFLVDFSVIQIILFQPNTCVLLLIFRFCCVFALQERSAISRSTVRMLRLRRWC